MSYSLQETDTIKIVYARRMPDASETGTGFLVLVFGADFW